MQKQAPHRKMQKQQKENKPFIDLYNIIKYFILWILFTLIAYGIRLIVLAAINISPTHQVGNGILTLYEVHNTGAAFNLFAGNTETIISLSFIAIAALTFVILIASTKLSNAIVTAMAVLSGGITMNLVERIQQRYVIDYIHCNFLPNFPVFNFADILVVVGSICLVLAIITRK